MRISIFAFFIFVFSFSAQAKITVYACEPEWASLAREIVGNKAEVLIGTSPLENPAKVMINNGLLNVIRKADMVFCTGGGLEKKWLVRAINESDNVKVRTNKDALLLVYGAENSNKEILPRPHLNPHNIVPVAKEFMERMKKLDAINSAFYEESFEKFSKKWNKQILAWEKAAEPLRGKRVVFTDDSWMPLINWLGLEVAAKIETERSFIKNNQRLNEIVDELKKNPAEMIIFANYEDKKPILYLSEKTKTRIVLLPFTVGGAANSGNLTHLFSTTINLLLVDCSKNICPRLKIENEVRR